MLFLKKIGEKAGDQVCFDGIDQFYKCFFFLHTLSFVTGEKLFLWTSTFTFFLPWHTSDYLYLLKNYH